MEGLRKYLQGFLHLDPGDTRIGDSRDSLRVRKSHRCCWGQMEMSDGCGGLALRACEENSPRSGGPCGLLEELPFICPVVVAVGSTIMIVIKLCKDLPQ
jgi:hypothetical protein